MGKCVAIFGLHLEANAFAPPTVKEDFTRMCWVEGEAINEMARTVSALPSELAGFYERMDAIGDWEPVPLVIAAAPPGGPIEGALFDAFRAIVADRLKAAMPVDAVYVPSHGASSATNDEDTDGTLVTMARGIVGPDVPIVVTHDLHCNVSERMIEATTAFVAYRTNPHVDMRARAAEAADLLHEIFSGTAMKMAFIRLPLVPPSVTLLTSAGPLRRPHPPRRGDDAGAGGGADRQRLGHRRVRAERFAQVRHGHHRDGARGPGRRRRRRVDARPRGLG